MHRDHPLHILAPCIPYLIDWLYISPSTMSQNKPVILKVAYSQVFVTGTRKLINTFMLLILNTILDFSTWNRIPWAAESLLPYREWLDQEREWWDCCFLWYPSYVLFTHWCIQRPFNSYFSNLIKFLFLCPIENKFIFFYSFSVDKSIS